MQRNFEEGLMCGLFMDCNKKSSNKNYKRPSNPIFDYILNNATLNLEIDMTSHYVYKRYYGYIPKIEDPNYYLFVNYNTLFTNERPYTSSQRIDIDTKNYSDGRTIYFREDHVPRNSNGYRIAENLIGAYKFEVWFRDNIPIAGIYRSGLSGPMVYFDEAVIYNDHDCTSLKEIVMYPSYAFKDITFSGDIPYLGRYKQIYKFGLGNIVLQSISEIPSWNITVEYKSARVDLYRPTYTVVNPNGSTTNKTDFTAEPIPKVRTGDNYYKQYSSILWSAENRKGDVLPQASDKLITDLTIKEYNECQMELINQIYAENNQPWELVRIKDYILLNELKPDKLPPELRYTK